MKTKRYVLKRDGVAVLDGVAETEIYSYIHMRHCYSVDHATRHEGYAIEERCPDCGGSQAVRLSRPNRECGVCGHPFHQ